MQLPNRDRAYIPSGKLTAYLLSETHAVGRAKAKFLRSFGFDESNVVQLERGLLAIAHTEPLVDIVTSPHGTKYVIDGLLRTPKGSGVPVRTVWIIESGRNDPRFVTAYPTE